MAKTSNPLTKSRLRKVIQVLLPKYRHITIQKNLNVVLSTRKWWVSRLFTKKDRIDFETLTSYVLPKQLTKLKYDNDDFFGIVTQDLISIRMGSFTPKDDIVFYIYKELIRIKYPHVFKEVPIPTTRECEEVYDEEYEESFEVARETRKATQQVNVVTKQTFLLRMQTHPMYYEWVVLGTVVVMILTYLIFRHG